MRAQGAGGPAGAGPRLIFMAAGERRSLPAAEVSEVVRGASWTRVPNGPPSLLGVANLRGAVLPIVSLAVLLGHASAAVEVGMTGGKTGGKTGGNTGKARILVVDRGGAQGARVGLLVDDVAALTQAAEADPLDLAPLLASGFAHSARPVSAGQRPASPATAALTAAAALAAEQHVALIGLRLAGQDYALRLSDIVEILALPTGRAHFPHTDPAMLGVIARPGSVLPLVSLRALLRLPADLPGASARVIVAKLGPATVGLVADAANEILRVPPGAFDPVPPVLTRGRSEARVEAICRLNDGRLACLLAVTGLLDAETTARILALAEGDAARMSDAAIETAGGTEQFVVFRLGDEEYGMPIAAVDEVVRRPATLTRIPHAPGFIAGLMNLRGRMIPVIEQRRRFSAGEAAIGAPGKAPAGRVLVVTMDGLQAGFAVDAVSEVLRVATADLRPTPDLAGGPTTLFDRVALQRDGRMILLVDPKALLDQAERDLLSAVAESAPPKPGP